MLYNFSTYKDQGFKWRFWSYFIHKHIPKDSAILEIGCAYGHFVHHLNSWKNYNGIDISKEAIQKAKDLYPQEKFIVMDAENLQFPPDTFSAIFCIDVLEHLFHSEECIKRCASILKKDGFLIITTPNTYSWSKQLKKQNWFAYQDQTHVSLKDPEQWEKIVEEKGFKIERKTSMDLFDLPTPLFKAINFLLYTLKHPFIGRHGDNLVIIARKS